MDLFNLHYYLIFNVNMHNFLGRLSTAFIRYSKEVKKKLLFKFLFCMHLFIILKSNKIHIVLVETVCMMKTTCLCGKLSWLSRIGLIILKSVKFVFNILLPPYSFTSSWYPGSWDSEPQVLPATPTLQCGMLQNYRSLFLHFPVSTPISKIKG